MKKIVLLATMILILFAFSACAANKTESAVALRWGVTSMPNTYEQFSAMVFNSPFGDYQRKTIDEVLKMESIGSVIVSWDFSHDKDKDILIVGKQEYGKVEIINAIQGPEAYALWKKLTIKNKK